MPIVYMHTSPSGKRYVGQTCRTVKDRWRKNGIGYAHSPAIENAIAKYGWDNIEHEILFEMDSAEEANNIEALLVNIFRTTDKNYGYNVRDGGGNRGKHSAESIKKMSDSKRGKTFTKEHCLNISKSKAGENNPNYGKPRSEEAKTRIGVANGKPVLQYADDGELLGEYYSASEAGRSIGVSDRHISACCRGERKHCGGFVWKYKGGDFNANRSA